MQNRGGSYITIESSAPHGRAIQLLCLLLLAAAAIIVYANSLHGVFLFDDQRSIINNLRIRDLSSLGKLLSGRRPVVDGTLAVNYAAGGLKTSGYHIVNLLIHLLAGLTLYGVVRRTLLCEPLRGRLGRASPFLAFVIALLWIVHPLQTQSVSYLIQRSESMMGLFYLLTLYCVLRGSASPHRIMWYTAAVVACALGMGSKAVMVTVPAVIFLFDRTFLAKSFGAALKKRWGLYLALVITWSVLVVCNVAPTVLSTSNPRATVGFSFKGISPLGYALTQPGVILHYLLLSVWPHPLCLDYDWPVALDTADYVLPGTIILALLLLTLWGWAKKPALGFVGGWFFLILLPTSSFIPIRDAAFEHRMYLPLAAVITGGVIAAYWIVRRLAQRFPRAQSFLAVNTVFLAITLVAALGYISIQRNKVYHGKLAMWQDVVAKRPNNSRALGNLAAALDAHGRRDEAARAIHRAVELNPHDPVSQTGLGKVLVDEGKMEEGISHYRKALAIDPNYANANRNLGVVLAQQGRLDEAIEYFRRATHGLILLADAHFNLAAALFQKGQVDEAIRECHEALRIDPSRYEAHFNLAIALQSQGKLKEAVASFRQAARLAPGKARVHYQLGQALVSLGKTKAAKAEFQRTLELVPSHGGAKRALAALQEK